MKNKKLYLNTPLLEANKINLKINKNIFLKMDAIQPTGSFKIRGLSNACLTAKNNGAKSIVASSGGNAGHAVAYSGRKLNLPTTVVVPKSAPKSVIKNLEEQNAKVIIHGNVWDDSHEMALKIAKKNKSHYIHPFDSKEVWKGNSTLIKEVAEVGFKPDAIILSVGGGGLLCGIMEGLIELGWFNIPIISVETEGAASLYKSLEANKVITLDKITTIARHLGAKKITNRVFELKDKIKLLPQLVSDKNSIIACNKFLNDYKILVEPACGATLSVVYDNLEIIKPFKNILVVVCGGTDMDLSMLNNFNKKFNI